MTYQQTYQRYLTHKSRHAQKLITDEQYNHYISQLNAKCRECAWPLLLPVVEQETTVLGLVCEDCGKDLTQARSVRRVYHKRTDHKVTHKQYGHYSPDKKFVPDDVSVIPPEFELQMYPDSCAACADAVKHAHLPAKVP
jgi:hypothetical protein